MADQKPSGALRSEASPVFATTHWSEVRATTDQSSLGNYPVLGRMGQGGMGAVYRARQLKQDRIVALKLLPFGAFSLAELGHRFRAEASAAAAVQHPNIVAVHDVGE